MNGIEILFILSLIAMLVIWGWFIVLGFRISKLWGVALIFLFPISPFMFAYRFERKTRQIIYYFIASLFLFMSTVGYIQFATVEFYPTLLLKLNRAVPHIKFSMPSLPKLKFSSSQPPKPPPSPELPVSEVEEPVEKPKIKPVISSTPKPTHHYRAIDIDEVGQYIGKKVIVTTSTAQLPGRLISVDATQLEIKKNMNGGSTTMPISKSKIKKVEVYL